MPSYEQNVYAIKPPDQKWKEMKAVWDSCKGAGIDPPAEVSAFFDHEPPDELGVVVELNENHPAMSSYEEEMRTGWEVDLSKIPPDTKVLRFTHSYD